MKTALLLSFAILLGRLSGLVRDMILSRSFGVSADYDVYSLAIMIPFFLRKIFAEGALTSAYIPTYNEKIKISEDEANAFTSKVFVLFSSVTLFLILLVEIHPNIVVKLFAGGLDQGRILKAQVMVRITFPFILFITIWSIAYGFLNSHSRYFNPAFSQVIANVTLIVGTILSVILNFGIVGVAVAFTIGGFLQMVYLLVDMKKHDFKFKFNLNTKMGDFPKIFFVSLLSFSISQLNSIVDLNIASRLPEGSISLMQYSLRIYNLPLGIFAIAFSTYAFP
ncbi:MAG: murein biosynthesis integral membrane protein MurJ, partial [Thermotoga sp.]